MATITITEPAPAFFENATLVSEPTPPRYSSLPGSISEDAAERLRAITGAAALIAPSHTNNDATFTDRLPPCYSSVFRAPEPRTSSESSRRRERNLSVRVGTPSDGRRGSADSNSSNDDNALVTSSSNSPGSSAPQRFVYQVQSGYAAGRSTPWATLKVFSRTSASPGPGMPPNMAKIPRFGSEDMVQGCLELHLENPQSFNSISLALKGRIVTSSFEGGAYTFYEQSIVNWKRADGDPRTVFLSPEVVESPLPPTSPSPSPSSASASRTSFSSPSTSRPNTPNPSSPGSKQKKYEGKLFGTYLWPFSFAFPTEITLPGVTADAEVKTFPAPQTFNEKGVNGSVHYELVLKMTHGVLKADSKLNTPLVYAPDNAPPAPSVLRQLAYSQQTRIPSPAADPFGWTTLPPTIVRGRFAGAAYGAKLQCSLSLANPQSYTRGSVIPLHLIMRSTDTLALSYLGKPECMRVQLVRKVRYVDDAAQALSSFKRGKNGKTVADAIRQGPGAREDVSVVGEAAWWVPPSAAGSEGDVMSRTVKTLEGEIHLERDMQPSCRFLLFEVSYELQFLGPLHDAFTPSSTASTVLIYHPVTITSRHADGPRPISVTPSPFSPTSRRPQRERERQRSGLGRSISYNVTGRERTPESFRPPNDVEMFMRHT